jgi:hypothetical protein
VMGIAYPLVSLCMEACAYASMEFHIELSYNAYLEVNKGKFLNKGEYALSTKSDACLIDSLPIACTHIQIR